jgi:HSP20 family protein
VGRRVPISVDEARYRKARALQGCSAPNPETKERTMAESEKRPVRWDPFREIERWSPLREWPGLRLGRVFDELLGEGRPLSVPSPAVDITEADDKYVVTAEVPGVKREDLTVELQDGVLSIRGEKKSEREETKEKARYLERSYGAFTRAFTLPADANPDRVSATFENGVLKVEVAKRAEAKPKTIAIKG